MRELNFKILSGLAVTLLMSQNGVTMDFRQPLSPSSLLNQANRSRVFTARQLNMALTYNEFIPSVVVPIDNLDGELSRNVSSEDLAAFRSIMSPLVGLFQNEDSTVTVRDIVNLINARLAGRDAVLNRVRQALLVSIQNLQANRRN